MNGLVTGPQGRLINEEKIFRFSFATEVAKALLSNPGFPFSGSGVSVITPAEIAKYAFDVAECLIQRTKETHGNSNKETITQ